MFFYIMCYITHYLKCYIGVINIYIYSNNVVIYILYLIMIGHIIVNITCNICLCKVYIPMYWKYIMCYVANLENRWALQKHTLLVWKYKNLQTSFPVQHTVTLKSNLWTHTSSKHWKPAAPFYCIQMVFTISLLSLCCCTWSWIRQHLHPHSEY